MAERTPPRWRVGKWNGRDNYECTRCAFATLDRGLIVRHAESEHPLGPAPHPLAGVGFASDEAAELAIHLGVDRDALERHTPSGKSGGYTVADVKAARNANTED